MKCRGTIDEDQAKSEVVNVLSKKEEAMMKNINKEMQMEI